MLYIINLLACPVETENRRFPKPVKLTMPNALQIMLKLATIYISSKYISAAEPLARQWVG